MIRSFSTADEGTRAAVTIARRFQEQVISPLLYYLSQKLFTHFNLISCGEQFHYRRIQGRNYRRRKLESIR
jgi:hypothetical protein